MSSIDRRAGKTWRLAPLYNQDEEVRSVDAIAASVYGLFMGAYGFGLRFCIPPRVDAEKLSRLVPVRRRASDKFQVEAGSCDTVG